jgi:endonuclease-3
VPAAHAYSLRTRSAPSTAPRSDEDEPEDIKPKGKGRQKDGADDAAYSDSAVKRAAPSASPAKRRSSASASPNKKIAGIKRAADSPEPLSPRKTKLPPKLELSQEETLPPPPHWEETLRVLSAQRTRIVAPVDTMGCEENGREERRADAGRERESDEEEKKRERLAVLIGLMLSSQVSGLRHVASCERLQQSCQSPSSLTPSACP